MNEWAPAIIGLVTIAVLGAGTAIASHLWPQAWIVTALTKPIGLRITGPYHIPTRRDQLRRAGRILLSAPLLFGAALLALEISGRFPGLSNARLVAEVYFFTLLLLSGTMLLMGLATSIGALRAKPITIVGDAGSIARDLAQFLEAAAEARIDGGAWPDFAAIRYLDPQLESLRISIAAQFPHSRPPRLPADGPTLLALATSARAVTPLSDGW